MGRPIYHTQQSLASFDPEEDNLLRVSRAVQIIDTMDGIDHRDYQRGLAAQNFLLEQEKFNSQLEEQQRANTRFYQGLALEKERNGLAQDRMDLDLRNEKRAVEEERLKVWKENKAVEAASASAAMLPSIDLNDPEGEKSFYNLLSYARANYVPEDSIRSTFGPGLDQLGKIKEERATQRIQTLGAEGVALYEALKTLPKEGSFMTPERAANLALQSRKAQETLAYYQKFAEEKGVAFDIPPEEMKKIRKRIGGATESFVSVPTSAGFTPGSGNQLPADTSDIFDPRPVLYDMEAVQEVLSKYVNPELRKAADAAAAKEAAGLALTKANTRKADAEATKAEAEAKWYGAAGGAVAPTTGRDPGVDLFNP
jgi:hypothetical protein